MKWENIGFPSNWKPEDMYKAFKKIYLQLIQQQQNQVMGFTTVEYLKGKLMRKNSMKTTQKNFRKY